MRQSENNDKVTIEIEVITDSTPGYQDDQGNQWMASQYIENVTLTGTPDQIDQWVEKNAVGGWEGVSKVL